MQKGRLPICSACYTIISLQRGRVERKDRQGLAELRFHNSREQRDHVACQEWICRSPRRWFRYAQSGNAPSPQKDARMPPCVELHEWAKSNRSGPTLITLSSERG